MTLFLTPSNYAMQQSALVADDRRHSPRRTVRWRHEYTSH